jgi:CBS-domain-containing membrane protein
MKAMDVMVRDVVTVKPETDVASAIKLLIEHDISALPVVDDGGMVVGMLSEADLVRRAELGTDKQRPWWLEALTPGSMLAEEFAKAHGLRASEVMSPRWRKSPRCWKSTASSAFPSSRTASWSAS